MAEPEMFDFKNASKKALQQAYKRIAKATGDDRFFTKKELNHLPKVLMDGEQVSMAEQKGTTSAV